MYRFLLVSTILSCGPLMAALVLPEKSVARWLLLILGLSFLFTVLSGVAILKLLA